MKLLLINKGIIWISALRNGENYSKPKLNLRFESSVNSDSIQTIIFKFHLLNGFESSVNSDSIQTLGEEAIHSIMFESSVNSDSIQTALWLPLKKYCLRVV